MIDKELDIFVIIIGQEDKSRRYGFHNVIMGLFMVSTFQTTLTDSSNYMNNYKTNYSEMIQTTNIFDNNLVTVTSVPPGLGRLAFSTHCIAWQQESWSGC